MAHHRNAKFAAARLLSLIMFALFSRSAAFLCLRQSRSLAASSVATTHISAAFGTRSGPLRSSVRDGTAVKKPAPRSKGKSSASKGGGGSGTIKQQRPSTSVIPKVLLRRNRQSRTFRDGNQLVFTGSIDSAIPPRDSTLRHQMGSFVQVEVPASSDNSKGQPPQTQLIGWGMYNPESMYRVRILAHTNTQPDLANRIKTMLKASQNSDDNGDDAAVVQSALREIVHTRLQQAITIREAMGLGTTMQDETDTYRLINGEGDGLSGLAVDVVGGKVAVVMSSAAWCEIHRPMIEGCLHELLDLEIIWRTTPSRLKQDGYMPALEKEAAEDDDEEEDVRDSVATIATENGIKYLTYVHGAQGQKTGVYCDQRENRAYFAQSAKGKRVLDLCCYHGGFALNAAKQGASYVVGVDSSSDAVDTCDENSKLNSFDLDDSVELSFVRDDISNYLQKNDGEYFDQIVLDPPKLAPSISGLAKASRKYHSLNRDAIKCINPETGGLFMTCTCSAAMTQKDGGNYFLQVVQQASLSAKRQITLLRVNNAAPCHTQDPASFPAGKYLTAATFFVHPV